MKQALADTFALSDEIYVKVLEAGDWISVWKRVLRKVIIRAIVTGRTSPADRTPVLDEICSQGNRSICAHVFRSQASNQYIELDRNHFGE